MAEVAVTFGFDQTYRCVWTPDSVTVLEHEQPGIGRFANDVALAKEIAHVNKIAMAPPAPNWEAESYDPLGRRRAAGKHRRGANLRDPAQGSSNEA
jgi:hypothetical protein